MVRTNIAVDLLFVDLLFSLIRFTWCNSLCPQPPFGLGTNREAAAHWDNNNHHSTVHNFAAGRRNHAPHQTD